MADPRFKHGMIRSDWHKKPEQELDSPIVHGWTPIDVNDEGYTIFALGNALMRATMPRDRLKDQWIVFLDGKVLASYSGPLSVITEDVRKVANEIPFEGEPYPQTEGSEIGEAGL